MTPEEKLNRIRELSAEVNRLIDERYGLLQSWAVEASPLKVGDETKASGYSFTNKRCKVTDVSGRLSYSGNPEIHIVASVLKKDGTPSMKTADWPIRV